MKKSFNAFRQLLEWRDRTLIQTVELTKPIYTRWFKQHRPAWGLCVADLKKFPSLSLGHQLGEFLEREGFELLPKLEVHDVMHVLMDFKTTVVDEARMQFFLLGNGKRSLYALVTAIVSMLFIPEALGKYFQAFRKGQRCLNISKWDFRYLLGEPVQLLRMQISRQYKGEEPLLLF